MSQYSKQTPLMEEPLTPLLVQSLPMLPISSSSPKVVKKVNNIKHAKVGKSKPSKNSPLPRPYNRYNLFFILERERLIHARGGNAPRQCATDKADQDIQIDSNNYGVINEKIIDAETIASVQDGDYSSLFFPLSIPKLPKRYSSDDLNIPVDWYVPISKEKKKLRSHTKTHGVASFVDLAKNIGANWKAIQEEVKSGDMAAKETLDFVAAVEKKIKKRHDEIMSHMKWSSREESEESDSDDKKATVTERTMLSPSNEGSRRRFSLPESYSNDSGKKQEQPRRSSMIDMTCCVSCEPVSRQPINSPPPKAVSPFPVESAAVTPTRPMNVAREQSVVTPSDFPCPPFDRNSEEYFECRPNGFNVNRNYSRRVSYNDNWVDQQWNASDDLVMQDFGDFCDDYGESCKDFSRPNNFGKKFPEVHCSSRGVSFRGNISNSDFENYNHIKNINMERSFCRTVSMEYDGNNYSSQHHHEDEESCDEELGFQEFVKQVRRNSTMTSAVNDGGGRFNGFDFLGERHNSEWQRSYPRSASDGGQSPFDSISY